MYDKELISAFKRLFLLHRSKNLPTAARLVLESRHKRWARSRGRARDGRPRRISMADIKTVGVIGAGQMGGGIAHVCALAGYDVKLNDVTADRVKAGIATINGNMARQVRKKTISEEDRQGALKRITAAESYEAFGDCDLVIEA